MQADFEKFYVAKHKGRCLSWNIQMGTCLIQANFNQQQVKLLDMSCSQAIILLAFNDMPRLSCTQIAEMTGLTEAELKR